MSSRASRKSKRDKAEKVSGFVLSVIDGLNSGREYHFEADAQVGRVEENDVIMVDPGISRLHARIHGRRGVFLVEDLGSSNGTRLNGELIEGPEVLKDGDYVGIGQATLEFSNMDLDRAGDVTARLRLTEKQQKKLDQGGTVMGSPKERIVALWKTPRGKLFAIAGGFAFLILGAGMLKQCFPSKKQAKNIQPELSGDPVDYDEYHAKGYWSWSFGYGAFNRNYRDKVSFRYVKPPEKLRVTLEYAAWGIDDSEEVVILVNGKRVGTVPTTKKITLRDITRYKYAYGLGMEIPLGMLKDGENLITFDNTQNDGSGTDLWEISYVKLRETSIPPPSRTKAMQCLQKARGLHEQANVDPANLMNAIRNYECARDYLEEMPVKPAQYGVAREKIISINKVLNKKFRQAMFDAQKSYRQNEPDAAKAVLQQTILYFKSNPRDPRYINLRKALDSIG